MPIEIDESFMSRPPLVTWTIAIVIAVVSLVAWRDLERAIDGFGFIPKEAWRHGGLTFFTAAFLHSSLWHLLGNLYFFLVFGDDLENRLGPTRFGLLLLASAFGGHLLERLVHPTSPVPLIGASGSIAGVIAFYVLAFPRAQLGTLFLGRLVRMPAWVGGLLWVGIQISGTRARGNVAYWAHLGGAAMGSIFWLAQQSTELQNSR